MAPVDLPPLDPAIGPTVSACVIEGTGEIDMDHEAKPLVVNDIVSDTPMFVVRARDVVHVTWSNLPLPSRDPHRRAKVDLGGQKLMRAMGRAEIAPRNFQIVTRADVVRDHVWIRGGSKVTLLGEDSAGVHVEVPSTIDDPKTFSAPTKCGNVAYELEPRPEIDGEQPAEGDDLFTVESGVLSLHTSPNDKLPFVVRVTEPSLTIVERKDAWARVTGTFGQTSFDAWTPAASLSPLGVGLLGLGGFGSGVDGISTSSIHELEKDAPLSVGPESALRTTSAFVEEGARLILGTRKAGFVAFTFEDDEIVPLKNEKFWLPVSAL